MQMMIPKGVNILGYLRDRGIMLPAYCSGGGVCGKCVIKLLAGELDISPADRARFSKEELSQGYRLACQADTKGVTRIEINEAAEISAGKEDTTPADTTHTFGLALDIGTTTLAMSLIDMTDKRTVKTHTCLNHQAAYGADVITRIKSSLSGEREKLQSVIQNDIAGLIKGLECGGLDIKKMTVSANTAMYHMLSGLDCTGLSRAPFEPLTLGGGQVSLSTLLGGAYSEELIPDIPVTLIRGISSFVGGDIVSGLCAAGLDKTDGTVLFADLGTNGESALIKDGRIYCTSAAAGPALEGGELSCGMGGVKGAISRVYKKEGRLCFDVIGGGEAEGLCGSAVIDLLAILLDEKIIDSTGRLDESFGEGFSLTEHITLTQDDIRAVQLAKAAIRASLDTLLITAGADMNEVDRLLISGGFGYYLDPEKAGRIGLLPSAQNVQVLGNTSLKGAEVSLYEDNFFDRAEKLAGSAEYSELGDNDEFKRRFIGYIDF